MTHTEVPEGIRIHPRKGGKFSYEVRIKRQPLPEHTRTLKTLDEAIKWKSTAEALISNGIDPSTVIAKKVLKAGIAAAVATSVTPNAVAESNQLETVDEGKKTVRQAVERYLAHRAKSPNPLPSNKITDYERVAGDWEAFVVAELRNEDLVHYISLLLRTPLKTELRRLEKGTLKGEPKTYAPATVRKFYYAMKKAFEFYAKNSKITLNPFLFDFERDVIPAAWGGNRERRLKPGEEERLYAAGVVRGDITYTPDDWRALLGFTLESAMRQQELAWAEWEHIIEPGNRLFIPAKHTKTNSSRYILLTKRAREIIEIQRKTCPSGSKRIFHQFTSPGSICVSFAGLATRAGIHDLTFHDLRHEATSRLCQSSKLPMLTIMEMTGHSSMATFQKYVHLIESENQLFLD